MAVRTEIAQMMLVQKCTSPFAIVPLLPDCVGGAQVSHMLSAVQGMYSRAAVRPALRSHEAMLQSKHIFHDVSLCCGTRLPQRLAGAVESGVYMPPGIRRT